MSGSARLESGLCLVPYAWPPGPGAHFHIVVALGRRSLDGTFITEDPGRLVEVRIILSSFTHAIPEES